MTDQLTEVRDLTFEERCALARKAAVGDRWRKRKQHEHFCQILANDGHGNLKLAHWNGRVTHKWYHYLASEYEPVPAATPSNGLLPCPFCGGASLKVFGNAVQCMDVSCSATGPDLGHSIDEAEAIRLWNRRGGESR